MFGFVLGADPAEAAGGSTRWETGLESWLKQSFVEGREYFVLRSGRAKMIVQADRSDLAPSFLYLLFDAQNNRQTGRKERAFHFDHGNGFVRSGLEVVLGGHVFTAWGHQTRTRWCWWQGVPVVEAQWWAGGVLVTERIAALADDGVLLRQVELKSVNLGGAEALSVRLHLPAAGRVENGQEVATALDDGGTLWLRVLSTQGRLRPRVDGIDVEAIPLGPGETATIESWVGLDFGVRPPDRRIRAEALEQTQLQWKRSSQVTTDDTVVAELFDRVRIGLPAMVADNGVMDAGMFEYGAQWVRDTSNTVMGLVHTGHFELARSALAHVLTAMVNPEGNTMIAGRFEDPDREQFDQMGELLLALKAYCDWAGDETLVHEHREKLVNLIERPLRAAYRGQGGMVHNRREFWERTLEDGYELAYQAYLISGLRAAASLSQALGVPERADGWRAEADGLEETVLRHPRFGLVDQGRLIKRRTLTGERVRTVQFPASASDVPLKAERVNLLEPDSSTMLPLLLGIVPPESALGRATLAAMEELWSARWWGGGYERYHSSGQCDQPGPWTFASGFILRAQHDAGLFERSRRTLRWLHEVPGGRTGAWFEEVPIVRSQAPTAGILPWTSAEVGVFVVRHLLGLRFESGRLSIKPALFPGQPPCRADLRFRDGRIHLYVSGSGSITTASLDGRAMVPDPDGRLRLPEGWPGGDVRIDLQPK
ncbi:MAG: hypothetical protein JNN01_02675 [Opitutaceae bacterium]|nr:hypothetical protein [Opitutaceae bacterium]